MKKYRMFVLSIVVSTGLLSGCAAPLLMLGPALLATPLVGGMLPSDNEYTIDESTVTPEFRQIFRKSKTIIALAPPASHVVLIPTAEYLDAQGAFEMRLKEIPASIAPAQRREAMRDACSGRNRPDLVMAFSSASLDSGGGKSIAGMFAGRAMVEYTSTTYVQHCKSRWEGAFGEKLKMNQGAFNLDKHEVYRVLGQDFAKALMRIAGDSSAGGVVSSRSSALSLKQVQTYLAALGYRPGLADGVMGRNTLIALKEFQRDYSLEETGQPDQETSAVLQEQYIRRQ